MSNTFNVVKSTDLLPLLLVPELQVIAVCDPNQDAVVYRDWSKDGLRDDIRAATGKQDWVPGGDNAVAVGRENGKSVVNTYYANKRPGDKFNGCNAYADYRELLEKERDLDVVKIMTTDHLHGVFAMAALKRNKHILMYKPLFLEGKAVIEKACECKSVSATPCIQMITWKDGLLRDWLNY